MFESNVPTITVKSSRSAIRADGLAGLIFETLEEGPIAFAVNLAAIEALRGHLAVLERHLKQCHPTAQ